MSCQRVYSQRWAKTKGCSDDRVLLLESIAAYFMDDEVWEEGTVRIGMHCLIGVLFVGTHLAP